MVCWKNIGHQLGSAGETWLRLVLSKQQAASNDSTPGEAGDGHVMSTDSSRSGALPSVEEEGKAGQRRSSTKQGSKGGQRRKSISSTMRRRRHPRSLSWLQDIVNEMQQGGLVIKDRWHAFVSYKRCFVANYAITWLVDEQHAKDRSDAQAIGQQMLDAGLFRHVVNPDQTFLDKRLFFRFPRDAEALVDDSEDEWIEGDEGEDCSDSSVHRHSLSSFLPSSSSSSSSSSSPPPSSSSSSSPPSSTPSTSSSSSSSSSVSSPSFVTPSASQMTGNKMSTARSNKVKRIQLQRQVRELKAQNVMWKTLALACLLCRGVWGWTAGLGLGVCAVLWYRNSMVRGDDDDDDEPNSEDAGDDCSGLHRDSSLASSALSSSSSALKRLGRLRSALEPRFPHAKKLTDAYLSEVLAAPGKNNPDQPRTLKYATSKMVKSLEWRANIKADSITHTSLQQQLTCGSLYWYGYDTMRRPVLWVHPRRKDWAHLDVEAEVKFHVLMLEYGISVMPKQRENQGQVTDFTVIAVTESLGFREVNLAFAKALLTLITTGYPDRLGGLYAGPVNAALKMVFSVMSPLMSKRLVAKVHLMQDPAVDLKACLATELIPRSMGGQAVHDIWEGEGCFSWDKMQRSMHELQPG